MNVMVGLNLVAFAINLAGYITTGVCSFLIWAGVTAVACFVCLDKESKNE